MTEFRQDIPFDDDRIPNGIRHDPYHPHSQESTPKYFLPPIGFLERMRRFRSRQEERMRDSRAPRESLSEIKSKYSEVTRMHILVEPN